MAIEVERLIASLEARIDKYEKNLAKASRTTDKTFTGIEQRGKKMQASLAATFSSNFGKGFLVGAAGAVGVGTLSEIPGTIRKIVAEAAGLVDTAAKLGITTDALQELHFAATQGGASIEDMDKALGFWTKTVGQALDGTGELAKVLAEYNIALVDGAGKVRAPIEILRDYADVIQNASSEQERARLTTIAFGRAGADMANVLRDGKVGLNAQADAFKRLGGAIDGDVLKQIAEVDDKLDAYFTKWELGWKRFALNAVTAFDDVSTGAGRIRGLSVPIPKNLQPNLPQNMAPEVRQARAEIDRLRAAFDDVLVPIQAIGSNPLNISPTGDAAREVLRLTDELKAGAISITEFEAALDAVAKSQPSFSPTIKSLKELQREIFASVAALSQIATATGAIAVSPKPWRLADTADRARAAQEAAGVAGLADASKGAGMSTAEKRLADEMERLRKAIEQERPGAIVTDAQLRTQAASNLAAGDLAGVISGYVDRVVNAESSGNRFAKNEDSSATGLGQFITETWVRLFKANFPDRARGMSDAAIAALRTEADTSKTLIEAYARENAAVLQRAGVTVTEAALQLAHFLGAGDAAKVLTAAPGTPLKGLISQDSIDANPTVLGGGRTVDDAIAYAQKRAGQTTAGTQRLDSNQDFEAYLAQQQATVAGMREEIDLRRQLGAETIQNTKAYAEFQRAQELLADAQSAGAAVALEVHDVNTLLHGDLSKLTPAAQAQAEKMRELAASYGLATEASAALDAGQQQVGDKFSGVNDIGRDALGSLISDLREGKSAAEALANMLDRVADRLINMALDAVFSSSGGGGGGGLGAVLSAIFGSFGGGAVKAASGGEIRGPGTGTSDSIAAWLSNGEYVLDAKTTKRIGARNLDALRRSPRHYASGGLVGPGEVAMGRRAASSAAMAAARGPSLTIAPVTSIDARGSQMGEAQFRAILAERDQKLAHHVEKVVIPRFAANRWRTSP